MFTQPTAGLALRWGRAILLGTVAMASGAVAHVAAGGLVPGRAALGLLLGACVLTAASLLGRPASTLRVVVLLMAGQTFIHGCLTAMSGHRGDPPLVRGIPASVPTRSAALPTGEGRRVGSFYDQVYAHQPGAAPSHLTLPVPIQHLVADLTGPHAVMALAHLAAAAAIGLWLAMGERALWTVVSLMTDLVRDAVRRSVVAYYAALTAFGWVSTAIRVPRPRPLAVVAFLHPPLRRLVLRRCVVRRGPPALLAA
jgi:hypothetical protein